MKVITRLNDQNPDELSLSSITLLERARPVPIQTSIDVFFLTAGTDMPTQAGISAEAKY